MRGMTRATHSARLERWLGVEEVERVSASMRHWHGPPIAMGDVPGHVFACGGGDFRGRILAGQVSPLVDYVEQRVKRIVRNASRRQLYSLHAGFSSLSDLISEAMSGGKRRDYFFSKNGATGTTAGSVSRWGIGVVPAAGANAANAPGGEALTDATVGAFPFTNPESGDTQHFVGGQIVNATSAGRCQVLIYDRLFQVNKTMNSNATESVTGVPTRYQSSTPEDPDYAAGNFAFPETGATALASGAHNWTVCKYRNQAGTDAQSFPSTAGISSSAARRTDLVEPLWFMPLADGDSGVMDLDQLQYDTSLIATGVINWVIGHPIAFMTVGLANSSGELFSIDGILTAFNLVRIFDDAALALLEIQKASTGAVTFNGSLTTVAG